MPTRRDSGANPAARTSAPPPRCGPSDRNKDKIAFYTHTLLPMRSAMRMEMDQIDGVKQRRRVHGRPLQKGQSGNPAGRPPGSRNRKTSAAALLLDGEAEALTRRAVELALAGDPTALRLCFERILPPCRERAVSFALPPIESAADIATAMKAVATALADGVITPGEAKRSPGSSAILRRRSTPATSGAVSRRSSAMTPRRSLAASATCHGIFNLRAGLAVDSLYFTATRQTR
jgi:hypothetical protein